MVGRKDVSGRGRARFYRRRRLTLTGYMNGCAAEKEIAVEVIPDPAANYHILTELCEGEETEIRLPEETNDLRFEWKDGSAEPVRTVDQPGEYPFSILAGDCVFERSEERRVGKEGRCRWWP